MLDQGLPYSAAHLLRAAGHDAVHVSDLGMSTASDEAILARARADGRVVVTLDADFHAGLALSGERAPAVIRLRDEKLRGEDVATIVLQVVQTDAAELAAGAVVTVRQGVARWRSLPM